MTIENLTAATPIEVDTVLADLYDQAARLRSDASLAAERIFGYAERRPVGSTPSRHDRNPAPEATIGECIAIIEAGEVTRYYRETALKQVEALREARAGLAANKAEQAPLRAEFTRRGGWTRAYLVLNAGGHVHSSMDCDTCFDVRYDEATGQWKPGTKFGWLPTMSGKDEAAIVEAAGSDACTRCFPTAPVETAGARTILHATEVEAQQARDEKARIKAEKAAVKAARAITAPDGSPLKGKWGTIATEVTARNEYRDAAATVGQYRREAATGASNAGRLMELSFEYERTAGRLLEALAAKHGVTVDVERATHQDKIDKKIAAYFR